MTRAERMVLGRQRLGMESTVRFRRAAIVYYCVVHVPLLICSKKWEVRGHMHVYKLWSFYIG